VGVWRSKTVKSYSLEVFSCSGSISWPSLISIPLLWPAEGGPVQTACFST